MRHMRRISGTAAIAIATAVALLALFGAGSALAGSSSETDLQLVGAEANEAGDDLYFGMLVSEKPKCLAGRKVTGAPVTDLTGPVIGEVADTDRSSTNGGWGVFFTTAELSGAEAIQLKVKRKRVGGTTCEAFSDILAF